MMKALFTTLSLLLVMIAQAQFTKQEHRVFLFSGEEVKGSRLFYEAEPGKAPSFNLDNEVFASSNVAYFQNNHGYFANLGKLHGLNSERYAMRLKTGKVNLFEEINIDVYGGDDLQTEGQANPQDPMLASGTHFDYYSKGDQPVRKASYKNLRVDLGDNAASAMHLRHYRNYRWLQWGLMGLGSGVITAAVMAQTGGPVKFTPLMAVGFVVGGGSYFLETPKQDALWLAADEYNKESEVLSVN